MPIFEYQCKKCGAVFEVLEKNADSPRTVHDGGCGGPLERLLSPPALQFKGSGWYITDYARGSSGNGSAGKRDSSKAESKTETSSESKKSETSKSPPAK